MHRVGLYEWMLPKRGGYRACIVLGLVIALLGSGLSILHTYAGLALIRLGSTAFLLSLGYYLVSLMNPNSRR